MVMSVKHDDLDDGDGLVPDPGDDGDSPWTDEEIDELLYADADLDLDNPDDEPYPGDEDSIDYDDFAAPEDTDDDLLDSESEVE
jgi:hypothetical protein